MQNGLSFNKKTGCSDKRESERVCPKEVEKGLFGRSAKRRLNREKKSKKRR